MFIKSCNSSQLSTSARLTKSASRLLITSAMVCKCRCASSSSSHGHPEPGQLSYPSIYSHSALKCTILKEVPFARRSSGTAGAVGQYISALAKTGRRRREEGENRMTSTQLYSSILCYGIDTKVQ